MGECSNMGMPPGRWTDWSYYRNARADLGQSSLPEQLAQSSQFSDVEQLSTLSLYRGQGAKASLGTTD